MVRQAAGLSLADVGRACGAEPSTVYRWETGERRPSGERALAYLAFIEQLLAAPKPRKPARRAA